MAKISRHHVEGCDGDNCSCPWRLDYRPQGLAGPRKRLEFPTKKTAERFLTETRHKVSRNELPVPTQCPHWALRA
jgi:hypothetical protein